ncbi:Arm DNA-binding domain-containing protein [Alcanivorax sp.]|uniref:Arm DNA-binding domain-containing protein n=1 Tax=Alcanivorax sp. TaxID=1872427 RepID=UPI0032D8EDDA
MGSLFLQAQTPQDQNGQTHRHPDQVPGKAAPKKHTDGGGLYFCARKSGSPYWMLRYSAQGKRHEITLGHYPQMSLGDAPKAAVLNKQGIRTGTTQFRKGPKLSSQTSAPSKTSSRTGTRPI